MTTPLRQLFDAIDVSFRATAAPDAPRQEAMAKTLEIMAGLDLSGLDVGRDEPALDGLHHLETPLAQMRGHHHPHMGVLADAIAAASHQLPWRVAHAYYYPDGANPGPGYLSTNMSCEIVGPEGAPVHAPDFRLGLFYFGAHVLYRDHAHLAPELYVTLAGPSHWRQDCGEWVEKSAGSMMFNEANQPHAMQSGAMPFFAIFVWLRDVHEKIALVPMSDWETIEADLAENP